MLYCPLGHAVQPLAPASEYVPAAQLAHNDEPPLLLYCPPEQFVHATLPPGEYCPALHIVHEPCEASKL